jgi:hypothetical protein
VTRLAAVRQDRAMASPNAAKTAALQSA